MASTVNQMETQEQDMLLQRALNGANEAPTEMVESVKESAEIFIDGVKVDTSEASVTSRLVESNGADTDPIYEMSLLVGAEFEKQIAEDGTKTVTPRATHSVTDEWTTDAYITATINCTSGTTTHGGATVQYMKLNSIEGSFTMTDSSCKLSNKKIQGGYTGYNLSNSTYGNGTSSWYSCSGSSITRSYTSPMLEHKTGLGGVIWAKSVCTITRYSQSWNVEAYCSYDLS